jgi:hypothetical protein
MKRIQKFAAINLMVALLGAGVPALAQDGRDYHDNRGMQYQSVDHRGDRDGHDNRYRNDWNDNRGYGSGYGYVPAPVYRYDGDYGRTHDGRAAAIIGGGAAAGALIGAAADHGQGALIGAVIGGIAGVAVNAAADHHHR